MIRECREVGILVVLVGHPDLTHLGSWLRWAWEVPWLLWKGGVDRRRSWWEVSRGWERDGGVWMRFRHLAWRIKLCGIAGEEVRRRVAPRDGAWQ